MQYSPVQYQVCLNPNALEISVVVTLRGSFAKGNVTMILPRWVPGDYDFEPYARDIFDLEATNPGSQEKLTVIRNGFNGFLIESKQEELVVSYRASAYEPNLGDAMGLVDSDYAILLGTRYLFTPQYLGPCEVAYETLPQGWEFHHPAGATQQGSKACWIYPSYEILLDTPVVFGRFSVVERVIQETPFYFVFVDKGVGFDQKVNDFIDQLTVAIDKIYDIFNKFPFENYTFVLSLNPQADWGLEHLTSNMSGLGPEVFVDDDQWANGIRVCVHELFHAWNVRRLRPKPLGQLRFDLRDGCFTEGLWVAEGFTRYYEFLISTRAKAYTPAQFFSAIASYYQHLSQQPAYKRVSAIDSSLATYTNHMKYPGRVNNSIDYYDKGMLIAFGIDGFLRTNTNGAEGDNLDKSFSSFYQKFFGDGDEVPFTYEGYTTEDVVLFYNERYDNLGEIINQQISEPSSLNTPQVFEELGLTPVWKDSFYIGLFFMNDNEPTIYGVADTSAAGEVGIAPADIIQSINGFAYTAASLKWAASQNDPVTIGILRGHRELTFTLIPKPIKRLTQLKWEGSESQSEKIAHWLHDPNFKPRQGEIFTLDFYENFHGIETLI